jgi:hypothetical protein
LTIILNAAISNQDSTRYDCERCMGSRSMNATGAYAHLLPASYVAREFVYGHVLLMRSEDTRPSRLRYFRSRTTFRLALLVPELVVVGSVSFDFEIGSLANALWADVCYFRA